MSQKVAKTLQVYATTDDHSKLLPNNEPWLAPLVLGIREMLSTEAVKNLKQHAASCKSKERLLSLDSSSDH